MIDFCIPEGEEITAEVLEEETASLTENQTQAVWKRVTVLNKTIRQMRTLATDKQIKETQSNTSVVYDRTVEVRLIG